MTAAASRLEREAAEVDALNVYPLPDGDTGRNMHRTISAAVARANVAGGATVAEVSTALARGALMGARGNSGVILSQILRGFADAFAGVETAGPAELSQAFSRARANAFAAVDRPAGGTMLSLCAAVHERCGTEDDIALVLRRAVEVGAEALARTMEDNPMNKAAGVVDAGAYGIWLLLVGAQRAVDPAAPVPSPVLRRAGAHRVVTTDADVAAWTGGHCVQYLVPSPRRAADELRHEMLSAGADSVLVVGDDALLKVHAHAAKPETVIAVGETAGPIEDLVVEDFDAMVAEHERATGIVLRSPPRPLAAIAVVPGDGFAAIVRSLYAVPLRGGATMNPSVGELVGAIEEANAHTVLLLPNDKNVILGAREAAKESKTNVRVLETKSVAQGMAALVAFDPMRPADETWERMTAAAAAAHSVEVTHATRDATIDGRDVRAGDAIALLDGRLVAHGASVVDVVAEALRAMDGVGIATLYAGAEVSDADAESAAERLRRELADVEVEVRRGGQPHYAYIVQAE
ncbi:MAG: DAK2 domain-containing protein [Chloroflexota bacterium]|nr:DAK2 domain-containing protein [Chloroflexota bacterium]